MMKFLKVLLLFLTVHALTITAQVRFEVEAPTSVDVNEPYFQIRYRVNTADASDISSPTFIGFDLLAGPSISTSRSFSSVNGHSKSSSSCTFTYTLAPQRKGQFTIPAASIQIGGKTYRSRSVTIKVTGSGQRSQTTSQHPTSPTGQLRTAGSRITDKDLYVTVTADRKKIYEQEAVLVTYKFHERPGVGLNSIALSKKPDFKGVVSQEIPVKSINANIENINGQSYRTGTIQQYLLFPQQTGRITLPGMTFDCVVIQRDNSIDLYDAFFNGGGNVGKSLKCTAPELTLDVSPLPSLKPATFSGGVGQFTVEGELLSPTLKTNEIATYRITVKGTGNLKLITAPALQFPSDFDTYSPKTTDQTEVTKSGLSGSITFDYTFMPRNTGGYELPAVVFTYFDPNSANYQTITLPARNITVEKGERSDEDVERELQLRRSDIRDIKPGCESLQKPNADLWWNSLSYRGCQLFMILLATSLFITLHNLRQSHADPTTRKRNKAGAMATHRMKRVKDLLKQDNDAAFYAETSHTLYDYMADKFNLSLAELNKDRIVSEMMQRGIPNEWQEQFCKIIDECELARFAPTSGTEQKATFYETTLQFITSFEEVYKKGNA